MKFYRTPLQSCILPVCSLIAALFSGCATAPRSTATAARPTVPPLTTASVVAPPPAAAAPTVPIPPPIAAPAPAAPVTPAVAAVAVRTATIKGSQESSILLDNYTAFVSAVDGKKIEAGRNGWDTSLALEAGRRLLSVEFNRGVFLARTKIELEAVANAAYELKYTTDAELFGHNSFCNFWIVDLRTGLTVTLTKKAVVEKLGDAPNHSAPP